MREQRLLGRQTAREDVVEQKLCGPKLGLGGGILKVVI